MFKFFPKSFEEFLTSLKAKSKVEGQKTNQNEASPDPFNFDEVLKIIGRFGNWQFRMFVLMTIVSILDGVYDNIYHFTAYTPKFRCSIPFCENVQNASYSNLKGQGNMNC